VLAECAGWLAGSGTWSAVSTAVSGTAWVAVRCGTGL